MDLRSEITSPLVLIIICVVAILVLIMIGTLIIRHKRSQRIKSSGMYVKALQAMVRGDEESALSHLKKVVSEDTGNIDAYIKLGDIFRRRGEPSKALQFHRQLTIRGDLHTADKIELLKSLTLDYIESDKDDRAIATLQDLISQDKRNLWAYEQLLDLYERRGDWDQALAHREILGKITDQKDVELLALYEVQIAHKLLAKGEYHKARLKYKDALRRDRSCAAAYLGLGDAYQYEGHLDDAIDSWKELLVKVPAQAYLVFGRLEKVLFDRGRFGEMTKLYRDLLERDPDNLRALIALATIYEKKGDFDKAIIACEKALEVNPKSSIARQYLVKFYRQKGNDQKVMQNLEALATAAHEQFLCRNCSYSSSEPLWHCPQCGQWRSFRL